MAWTTPGTAVDNTPLTASRWNTDVRDNTSFLNNPPAVRCTKSSTQAISAVTLTAVIFEGADSYDTDSMHNPASNNTRITFATAGIYIVTASVMTSAALGGYAEIFPYLNGDTGFRIASGGDSTGTLNHIQVVGTYKFAATDFIELAVYFQNARTITTTTSNKNVHFAATYLGSG